jgi:hypothetical protein
VRLHAYKHVHIKFSVHGPLVELVVRLNPAHTHVLDYGWAHHRAHLNALTQLLVRLHEVAHMHLYEQLHAGEGERAVELAVQRDQLPEPIR